MKRILCALLFVFGLLTSAWADSSRYASESVLNSGKWVKIQVGEDGIYKLTAADLGRFYLGACFSTELSVTNGNVYAYSPSTQPDELLADTLYLIRRNKLNIHEEYSSILPLCIAGRYLVSTYSDATDTDKNYTFCYDRREDYAYNVTGGFEDNFYHTGRVPDLKSLDIYNNSFCYCRSGEEVKKAFPDRTEEDNPVLFIVRMKA